VKKARANGKKRGGAGGRENRKKTLLAMQLLKIGFTGSRKNHEAARRNRKTRRKKKIPRTNDNWLGGTSGSKNEMGDLYRGDWPQGERGQESRESDFFACYLNGGGNKDPERGRSHGKGQAVP